MSYSVCIIDDNIPVDQVDEFEETQIISSSMLKFLLRGEIDWNEDELKGLTSNLLASKNISNLSAFNDPNFFLNHISETTYVPEAIIYDWNYKGLDTEKSKKLLIKILKKTFTIVFIYTREDQKHEIDEMISEKEFDPYSNRLDVIHKEEENSVERLIELLDKTNEKNFSFKFAKLLRNTSQDVINSILVELGKASLNQIGYYLQITGEDRRDLVEFIGERFKNHLIASEKFDEFDFNIQPDQKAKEDLGPSIWSNRIYHYERKDMRVRKGDLVKNSDNDIFLVITADCDLRKHWKKNYGFTSLVKLHHVSKENDHLKKQVLLTNDEKKLRDKIEQNPKRFSVTSLVNPINTLSGGPVLLPYLEVNKEFGHYVIFPKELESVYTELSEEGDKNDKFLRYDDKFNFDKVASISEPFLTPLIQHILTNISGYGTPDYPKGVKDELSLKLGEIFS